MSKSNTFETAFLNLVFANLAIANIGDASGLQPSAAAGNLYVALHTADPGEAGTAITSEATYTSYARVAVVRSAVGWTIAGNQVTNAALVTLPACTGGTNDITHFSITTASSGASVILFSGTVTPNLAVSSGITPEFAIGALTVTED